MKKIFFLLGFFCVFNPLNAQNTLFGSVTNSNHEPLVGTTVYIPYLKTGTSTDNQGNYEIRNLPNGKLKVLYSYVGYVNHFETVTFDNEPKNVNVTLLESALESEEIVITSGYNATQHDNAVKIDVLNINALTSSVPSNFTALLAKIPGIDMISKGNGVSKPVIRGLSMNDILILNNGVRFENYQYSSHHPTGIDEFDIEKIEVIKGPASLLYGSDAMGGVINFIKEKPASIGKTEGDFTSQYFSNSLGFVNNLGIKSAGEHWYGGIRAGQKSHADYLQGGGTFVPNSRFHERSLKTNLGLRNNLGNFNVFYDYNQQNLGLVEDEAIENISTRGRKITGMYQRFDTHLFSVQNKIHRKKSVLDVNASYQNTTLAHFDISGDYELQMALQTLTYEAKLNLNSGKNIDYTFGFQGLNQKNKNLNDRETILLPNATTANYSLFGLFQWNYKNKLTLQTGLRYDLKNIKSDKVGVETDDNFRKALDKNYNSINGSLGGTLHLSDFLIMRMNVASAFRTPNLAELTANGPHEAIYEKGSENLIPEKSFETDWSIHYHQNQFTLDVAAFYNTIKDYIFITPTGLYTTNELPIYQFNQANSYLYGSEIGCHFHPKNWDFLHLETTFSSVIGKKTNGDFLPFIPAHQLNIEISVENDNIGVFKDNFVTLNSHTAFKQNNIAPEETPTSEYSLLDISLGTSLNFGRQKMMFSLSCNNIFDQKYIDHLSTLKEVDLYNPGRNFTLNLKIPFEF